MSNNRELSQFAKFTTIDESGNNNVGIATTVRISPGGLYVDGVEVIGAGGAWKGPNSGLVGAQGAQGAQGYQGRQGTVGAQGAQGADGAQGDPGTVGAQGAQGAQGAVGAQGATGAQGAVGAQGNQGRQGAVGAQGNQGRQGAVGAQGNQGRQGAQGVQGAAAAGVNGKVIQVTSGTKTSRTYWNTSTQWLDSGLSATITPSSTAHKVLVHFSISIGSSGGAEGRARLLRNSTPIMVGDDSGDNDTEATGFYDNSGTDQDGTTIAGSFLDSPSTTSAITYKMQIYSMSGNQFTVGGSVAANNNINNTRSACSIVLMEIDT